MRQHTLGRMLTGRRARSVRGGRRSLRARPAVGLVEARFLPAVSIAIDYSFDSTNFFDTQPKRDLMQLAANTVASALNDSLAAIAPGGGNTWTATFPNPSTRAS